MHISAPVGALTLSACHSSGQITSPRGIRHPADIELFRRLRWSPLDRSNPLCDDEHVYVYEQHLRRVSNLALSRLLDIWTRERGSRRVHGGQPYHPEWTALWTHICPASSPLLSSSSHAPLNSTSVSRRVKPNVCLENSLESLNATANRLVFGVATTWLTCSEVRKPSPNDSAFSSFYKPIENCSAWFFLPAHNALSTV